MVQPAHPGRACVFLDRDGTLNLDVGYAHLPEQLVVQPGVVTGLAALRAAGLLLVVVTNQSGVARGYYAEADILTFHRHLDQTLGPAAAPDAYYYCPYHPDGVVAEYKLDSSLRKPNTGMFEQACRDLGIDARRSFMVGDTQADMLFARRAGLKAILLSDEPARDPGASYLVRPSFGAAADAIIALRTRGEDAWRAETQPQERA